MNNHNGQPLTTDVHFRCEIASKKKVKTIAPFIFFSYFCQQIQAFILFRHQKNQTI